MKTANKSEQSEIEGLLLWHAAGTLSHRDTQRVEAALAGDAELIRRYQLVCEELAQTIRLNRTFGTPSPLAMQALLAKIDAKPVRCSRMSLDLGARIGAAFASLSPHTLAWSASGAALAILLQAGLIAGVMLHGRTVSSYETASVPTSVTAETAYALIGFQPQATAAAVTNFLEAHKTGGPSASGIYRARFAATKLPNADIDAIVKTLREDKVVSFIAVTDAAFKYCACRPIPMEVCHAKELERPAASRRADALLPLYYRLYDWRMEGGRRGGICKYRVQWQNGDASSFRQSS
jgi:hypothetical protein